jgi:CRISPR-associated protein Cmr6
MTQLMRTALRPLYRDARDAHPGLLVQRGYEEYDNTTEAGRERKTAHIRRICDIPASDFYINAFNRWSEITSDQLRFRSLRLSLESRLFIGLSAGGMLESGCAISHSYGMPYIPGSSIKGAVTSYVCATDFGRAHPELKRQALEDIRSRWQARDWWAEPPGGSARKAKAIYEPPEVSE